MLDHREPLAVHLRNSSEALGHELLRLYEERRSFKIRGDEAKLFEANYAIKLIRDAHANIQSLTDFLAMDIYLLPIDPDEDQESDQTSKPNVQDGATGPGHQTEG